ncbi:MlaA family lipoprotein [Albidovulum sp.]|uniref:MlaA family lipoprotein n=1 Tax=Albidovulum sp. TaxID=1872424 RepID=UPI00352724B6
MLACLALAAGCARQEPGAEYNDPFEAQNRAVHDENVKLDTLVFGTYPRAKPILPKPVAKGFSNFSSNLGMPSAVLNSLLQGKPGPALQNTLRFALNTTVGLGGVFDPAGAIGIYADDADFGETLHVWGAPEGAYLVLPFAGPTTERDLAGSVVDIVINPLNAIGGREAYYLGAAKLAGGAGNRSLYSDTVDSILYESADSYAQLRLMYLQYRHHQLGIEEDVFDPYEDPYGQ